MSQSLSENTGFRILKASILMGFSIFVLFVYPKVGREDEVFFNGITAYGNSVFGKEWGENFGNIARMGFYILVLAGFIRGIYYIRTYNQKNTMFEDRAPWWVSGEKSPTEYNNLNKVLEFRESRLNMLDYPSATNEYLESSWLDGAISNSNSKGVQKSLEFLESKLAGMSPSDGYEYIKNHRE